MLPRDHYLGERGWNTYMVGKWHLCPTVEMNVASHAAELGRPGRGSNAGTASSAAETNQWYPDLVYDNHPVDQPKSPARGYHPDREGLTDKALEFIKDARQSRRTSRSSCITRRGGARTPSYLSREWADKFKGAPDMGYRGDPRADAGPAEGNGHRPGRHRPAAHQPDRYPETRKGPKGQPFPPLDFAIPWDSLSAEEKQLFCRMAEVYAGFLAHADHHIGRLPHYLEKSGQRGEHHGHRGVRQQGQRRGRPQCRSINEMMFANGIPDDIESNLAMLDKLGGTRTYNHYPSRWAMAFNTPFKMWKRYEFNGGTADPCIISWPSATAGARRARASCATSTTTRSISCRPFWTPWALSHPRQSRDTCRAGSTV